MTGVASALQYTCTCGTHGVASNTRTNTNVGVGTSLMTSTRTAVSTNPGTTTGMLTGTQTAVGNLSYITCDEATACVPACPSGAQTAGSTCATGDDSCAYTNVSGASVTCTCGGYAASRVWSCR